MSNSLESLLPSDIRLLLRADAEHYWLHREVIPVLRDVEADGQQLSGDEANAALAYLEAMWQEATQRARETDAAHRHLCSPEQKYTALMDPASRYHEAVQALRRIVAERVTPFVERTLEHDERRASPEDELRLRDARPGSCAA
jgi:hypothetical protein